mgnify:CR=1 FL=1
MTVSNSKIVKSRVIQSQRNKMSQMDIIQREANKFDAIIQETVKHANRMKECKVFTGTDFNQCITSLEKISSSITELRSCDEQSLEESQLVAALQGINNDVAAVFKTYGTYKISDLITVCLGSSFVSKMESSDDIKMRWAQIAHSVHPISYKVLSWKNEPQFDNSVILKKNKIIEDVAIVEHARTLDCFDLGRTCREFYKRVHGVKIAFQNFSQKRTLIVSGIIDDLPLWTISPVESERLLTRFEEQFHGAREVNKEDLRRFTECLTLKDYLIYNCDELSSRFLGMVSQAKLVQKETLSQAVKNFITAERYAQRMTLIQLLIKGSSPEYQYLAYLLFDLLSSDSNNNIDTQEQTELFDSLPSKAKSFFKDALRNTQSYTNQLTNFDSNKIPLEQQICLMKVSDAVKEKAMQKLKEVKNKNEDSGSKARQYLEGLLRIPFGVYRKEPVLNLIDDTRSRFSELIARIRNSPLQALISSIPDKQSYTGMEVKHYTRSLKENYTNEMRQTIVSVLTEYMSNHNNRNDLSSLINKINQFTRLRPLLKYRKIPHSGKSITTMLNSIMTFLEQQTSDTIINLLEFLGLATDISGLSVFDSFDKDISVVERNNEQVESFISDVHDTLTKAVHGHKTAKRQVERIIGQWVNGEQAGYCFGFEGPPGVGKTSLAKKGIAHCLLDLDQSPRPFTFIAIGGGTNGSTLEGHNYTYVASTWGRIVDILMEKKCMNPIIFIDELDKVSRTEHGREIIGILTHLIDPTQNDSFQDKYFNGIDLDLSKALFIFSYNDFEGMDRILLDRIHRVKFDALTIEDKLTIAEKYLLPEVLEKMGLSDVVTFDNSVIQYIIEHYTDEPGVRKLKELLFEIVGEINLSCLRNETNTTIPIIVTVDDVKLNYLKERNEIRPYKILRTEPTIGVINGLYANALGKGGVLPIEAAYVPSSNMFDLHLTGMQGDVMKESMQVAKTLALKLAGQYLNELGPSSKDALFKKGIHIHVPEGATKKDGPSAGTAITIALYSLLSNKPIREDIAITGEICLSGLVTAIGGLEQKIIGGIKAGAKHFLFPEENQKDFDRIEETYGPKHILDGIKFDAIKTIDEAIALAVV